MVPAVLTFRCDHAVSSTTPATMHAHQQASALVSGAAGQALHLKTGLLDCQASGLGLTMLSYKHRLVC